MIVKMFVLVVGYFLHNTDGNVEAGSLSRAFATQQECSDKLALFKQNDTQKLDYGEGYNIQCIEFDVPVKTREATN